MGLYGGTLMASRISLAHDFGVAIQVQETFLRNCGLNSISDHVPCLTFSPRRAIDMGFNLYHCQTRSLHVQIPHVNQMVPMCIN